MPLLRFGYFIYVGLVVFNGGGRFALKQHPYQPDHTPACKIVNKYCNGC